jgi:predicted XRE-type DNA-binding protein|tara:strand:- start:7622 stop:7915 length:294 start_codon:yes stop_codon:yes gene_type:complete
MSNDKLNSITTGSILDDPELFDAAEREVIKLKVQLFDDIRQYIESNKLNNTEAAKLFGVQRHRIIDIQKGRISGFTIDYLVSMLARVGLQTLEHKVA